MAQTWNVAILIFDEVEVLDFCGPFEVFGVTGRTDDPRPFNVYTVAQSAGPVLARNALSINPAYTLADCPPPDILLVPGGYGTRRVMKDVDLTTWVAAQSGNARLTLSVCTGALVLAKAGLLDGLEATTHHGAFDELRAAAPGAVVREDRRFVDNGQVILSAGISAGIDMSLHVVGRLLGVDKALETARYMEYDWAPERA